MLNEFRKDLVSGEWVLFATGRARRLGLEAEAGRTIQNKDNCPFEDPEKFGNEVLMTYPALAGGNSGGWFAKIAKNKFPAVIEGEAGSAKKIGPFEVVEAKGLHELVIFRDHERFLDQYEQAELAQVFKIYQERLAAMASYSASKYVLIFHNHGLSAGASVQHPHSQIISIPILPPDVRRSVHGAENFYEQHGQRVYDLMIDWEIAEKKRIVYENQHFIAFCPFVSITPYEVRIFPKESHAHFEKMPDELLPELADVMGSVLKMIHKTLTNPDFNFFIHTAPTDNNPKFHQFYSWHIEIIPKMKMEGAFELGSGIEVNVIDPDEAAKTLGQADV